MARHRADFLASLDVGMERSWETEYWGESIANEEGAAEEEDGEELDFKQIYAAMSAEEVEDELFNLVVAMKIHSATVNATSACLLCFWIDKYVSLRPTGDKIKRLSRRPGLQSGKYSHHFDKVVGGEKPSQDAYRVPTPLFRRVDGTRNVCPLPLQPPHEAIAEDMADRGEEVTNMLRLALREDRLPPQYHKHPVVVAAGDKLVRPLALYIDSVDFMRTDAVVGIWMQCLLDNRRWLLMPLRKSEVCHCGCGGECSYHPAFVAIQWSLRCLASGVYPQRKHDGSTFDDDVVRQSLAGSPIGILGAVVALKGDWHEWVCRFGFRSWSHRGHPCPTCDAHEGTIKCPMGLSPTSFPFTIKTWDDYLQACRGCEIVVALSDRQWKSVKCKLFYSKRHRGRALAAHFPELGLRVGDKLCPSDTLLDVGAQFDEVNPGNVTFWRASKTAAVRGRCWLFSQELGMAPDACIGSDWLHTFSLGVLHHFHGWLIWRLAAVNAWQMPAPSVTSTLERSVPMMLAEYFAWLKGEFSAGRQWGQIQNITMGMCGSIDAPLLKLYGAEGNGFLHFCGHLLQKYGHLLGAERHTAERVQQALAHIHVLIRRNPLKFDAHASQQFSDATNTVLKCAGQLGVGWVPKFHQLVHMAWDCYNRGSPGLWACWADERLNQTLKITAGSSHRSVWADRVLHTVGLQLKRAAGKKKRSSSAMVAG